MGKDGSKKPCECCRGLCLCNSGGGARGDCFLNTGSFGVFSGECEPFGWRACVFVGNETLLKLALPFIPPIDDDRGG